MLTWWRCHPHGTAGGADTAEAALTCGVQCEHIAISYFIAFFLQETRETGEVGDGPAATR